MSENDGNPFLKLAEAQMTAAAKAKQRWRAPPASSSPIGTRR